MAHGNTRKAIAKRISTIRTLRDTKREIDNDINVTSVDAITMMDEAGLDTISYEDDGIKIKGTVVKGTSLNINALKLKKKLGATAFNKLTTRTLDMNKLEAAIAEGVIDPKTVSACSTEEPKKPYIRITQRKQPATD